MAAGSHDSCEFAEARPRVGYVLDDFHAACDVEARIIERQLVSIRYEVFYPRPRGIQRPGMRNVPFVEVACDKVGRKLVELAVDIPFATTNVDHVPDRRFASDAIQYPQHPALTGAIGRQKKLIVHAPLTLTREVVYMLPIRKNRKEPADHLGLRLGI
jgi:hypothetical protein